MAIGIQSPERSSSGGRYTCLKENDKTLFSFSIDHDCYRIPIIKKARAAAGGKLTLYASPWTPPACMKTNDDLLQGGKLKKVFYQARASYYVKFIKVYEREGIPVCEVSIQNEPIATQHWEPRIYSAEEETSFGRTTSVRHCECRGTAINKSLSGTTIVTRCNSGPAPF